MSGQSERGRLERLHDLFSREVHGVSEEIVAGDGMYAGNREHYLGVGQSALRCIRSALLTCNKHPHTVKTILDLPCGHGRVLRTLRAAFPDAAITACDLSRDGVDHCARAFGAIPVYSSVDLNRVDIAGNFDLIWCGSLLTHLDAPRWEEVLDFFVALLNADGLLLFTSHGPFVIERIKRGWDYGLAAEDLRSLIGQYRRDGFGYVDYAGTQGYGISLSAPSSVLGRLRKYGELRVVSFTERGWDDHQDVVACLRDRRPAPSGPACARHAKIDFEG